MTLVYILVFTLLGSVLSLSGSYLLLIKKGLTQVLSNQLLNFATGALLATAFLNLLPEAVEHSLEIEANVFAWVLFGFVSFFFAERFIRVFHQHHSHGQKASTYLILIGDSIHNFIDGIAITTAFLTNIPLGISTAISVAAHEIPQEIADMSILLSNGLSRGRALFFNFLSALAALAGAILAYFFAGLIESYLHLFLALTAGHFIYIAASDLIPVLHEKFDHEKKWLNGALFISGILAVYLFGQIFSHEIH